ncbi:hypothetical protein ACFY4C_17010 [Actinomadura viridis]|uniref:hypothetical protein n=1 Tax=Actinomadura viridis TaxID=58110 RepID=UPI0036848A4B
MAKLPVRLAAAVLLVLPTAAGCANDEPAPVPAGFQGYRTGVYSFAYPAGWRRVEEKDERGRPVLRFEGPVLPSGVVDGQVHLAGYGGFHAGLDTALSQFRGLALLNRYRVTADRPVEIPGAVRARRFEAAYEVEAGDGARVPFTLLGVYAMTDRDVLVEFMLRWPRTGASASRMPEIFETFRLREK